MEIRIKKSIIASNMADNAACFGGERRINFDLGNKYHPNHGDNHVRVKLNVQDKTGANNETFTPSWYLVNSSAMATVFDLRIDIARKFKFPLSPSELHVDGYLLPDWESSLILRENDNVSLKYVFRNS